MSLLDPLSFSIPTASPVRPDLPPKKLLVRVPDREDHYSLDLDNSSRDLFTLCPYKAENYLIRGRRASKSDSPTGFGGLFHRCEEQRVLQGNTPERVETQHALVRKYFLENPSAPEDHRTEARMLEVLSLYDEKWQYDNWQEKVLKDNNGVPFVERPFRIPLCSIRVNRILPYHMAELVADCNEMRPFAVDTIHIYWTGRIDMMLEEPPYLFNVDSKTSKEGGKSFWDAFKNSGQTVGYSWAAQKILGRLVHGTMVNAVIMRPPLKVPSRGTLPRNEFDRRVFFYDAWMLEEWERNAKNNVTDLINCLVRGDWPQQPRSFKSPCEFCEFNHNCLLPPNQRKADLATELYTNVTWNPLDNYD